MPACIVHQCKSGYTNKANAGKKWHFFGPPKKDPELFAKWEMMSCHKDKKLTERHRVCHKHFTDDMLVTRVEFLLNDGSLYHQDLDHWRLKPGAYPCLFVQGCGNPDRPVADPKPVPVEDCQNKGGRKRGRPPSKTPRRLGNGDVLSLQVSTVAKAKVKRTGRGPTTEKPEFTDGLDVESLAITTVESCEKKCGRKRGRPLSKKRIFMKIHNSEICEEGDAEKVTIVKKRGRPPSTKRKLAKVIFAKTLEKAEHRCVASKSVVVAVGTQTDISGSSCFATLDERNSENFASEDSVSRECAKRLDGVFVSFDGLNKLEKRLVISLARRTSQRSIDRNINCSDRDHS